MSKEVSRYYVELSDCGLPYEWTLYAVEGTCSRSVLVWPDGTPYWEREAKCGRLNDIVAHLKSKDIEATHENVLQYDVATGRSGEAEAAYKEGMAFGYSLGVTTGRSKAFSAIESAARAWGKEANGQS